LIQPFRSVWPTTVNNTEITHAVFLMIVNVYYRCVVSCSVCFPPAFAGGGRRRRRAPAAWRHRGRPAQANRTGQRPHSRARDARTGEGSAGRASAHTRTAAPDARALAHPPAAEQKPRHGRSEQQATGRHRAAERGGRTIQGDGLWRRATPLDGGRLCTPLTRTMGGPDCGLTPAPTPSSQRASLRHVVTPGARAVTRPQ